LKKKNQAISGQVTLCPEKHMLSLAKKVVAGVLRLTIAKAHIA